MNSNSQQHVAAPTCAAPFKWLKQAFCSHYWSEHSKPMDAHTRFGMHMFTCVKCECTKVRMWNWAIRKNNLQNIE